MAISLAIASIGLYICIDAAFSISTKGMRPAFIRLLIGNAIILSSVLVKIFFNN